MSRRRFDFWLVAVLILLTGVAVNLLRYTEVEPQREPNLSTIPLQLGSWGGEELHFSEETYEVLKADRTLLRVFDGPKGRIWLFVAYFKSQKYGSQIHSPKHCLPGSGWKILKKETVKTNLVNLPGKELRLNKLVISDGTSGQLMLYWFITRSGIITDEFGLKFDLVFNCLRRKSTDAAFVRINLPLVQGKENQSWEAAIDFMDSFVPYMDLALGF